MKKLILLSIVILALYGSLSAINQDSVKLSLRKKALENYHKVKDTVTVRTWMNMDRMNKALIQIVEYDNQLLESYKSNDSAKTNIEQGSIDALGPKPLKEIKALVSKPLLPLESIIAVSVAAGILLLVLIVFLVKRSITIKNLRGEYNEREESFDSKFNRLEYLENEVLKMKTRENEVKAELGKGIVDYQEKMQTLRKRIEELADENTRLEKMNIALAEGNFAEAESSVKKTEEMKDNIIIEADGLFKRVKKVRK